MDKKTSEGKKIVKLRRGFHLNVGLFLIVIFIIYMGFHVFSSLTKKEVTAYEVTLGTIVEKNYFQGLILRQEEIVTADRPGSIYYYENNKSRVGVRSRIYATDQEGSIIKQHLSENDNYRQLNEDELSVLSPGIDSFVGNFHEVNFANTYGFKSDLAEYLQELRVLGITADYAAEIESAKNRGTFFDSYAIKPGFLVYTIDGYENKQLEEVTGADFNSGGISTLNLRSKDHVNQGDTVYKLVTSDDWKIVIPLENNVNKINELADKSSLKIRFTQDNTITWANSEIVKIGDLNYLVLSLDDSMERYCDQRYVNIELLLDEMKGLKIPNTAIIEKEFYTIPKSYFFHGGNSGEQGILVRRDNERDFFVNPTIYYETENEYYIDGEYVQEGDLLLMENSSNSYIVGKDKASLQGVYNINKGFTVFKQVEVTFKNDDYSIVKNQASYSIALYDHIVLVASSVKENEIL